VLQILRQKFKINLLLILENKWSIRVFSWNNYASSVFKSFVSLLTSAAVGVSVPLSAPVRAGRSLKNDVVVVVVGVVVGNEQEVFVVADEYPNAFDWNEFIF